MNIKCCLCEMNYKVPENEGATIDLGEGPRTLRGFSSAVEFIINGRKIKAEWRVIATDGNICPSCSAQMIQQMLTQTAKDIPGLLAGRKYGEEIVH